MQQQWIHFLTLNNMFSWVLLIFSHSVYFMASVMNMMPQLLGRLERLLCNYFYLLIKFIVTVQVCGSLKLALERVQGMNLLGYIQCSSVCIIISGGC